MVPECRVARTIESNHFALRMYAGNIDVHRCFRIDVALHTREISPCLLTMADKPSVLAAHYRV